MGQATLSKMCKLSDFNLSIISPWSEWQRTELESWHGLYLPTGDNVIDIGAGCGESAQFFLNHGAKTVVCVENHPTALQHLHRNFDNDPRVTIVPFRVDTIKVDCDGCEENMMVETHSQGAFWDLKGILDTSGTVKVWRLRVR